jgi:uncharacterized SAM-binding protein YcdF (DUF218 family)
MIRDNFSQLPNSAELQNILEAETKRSLPEGKEDAHYFSFSSLIKLAEHFGINAKILISNYTKEDVANEDLLEKGKSIIQELKDKILNKELSEEDIQVLNAVYDYLAEEDIPEKSDLIFVFGSKTPLRIEKAVELYDQGVSEIIVVSGRGPHYGEDSASTEAVTYARIAMDKGVPEKAIVIEDKSITIPDNVRSSLNLLDEKGVFYNSIILVNSPYTQRRGWAHFKKYLPEGVKFIRVNSGTGDQYKRDSWYKSPTGIDVIVGEYLKAKVAVSLNTA